MTRKRSNGHATTSEHSPNSSHLSVHSDVPSESTTANSAALVARTHKQQTTQQVTTVTKVVREVKHLGANSTTITGSNSVGRWIKCVTRHFIYNFKWNASFPKSGRWQFFVRKKKVKKSIERERRRVKERERDRVR